MLAWSTEGDTTLEEQNKALERAERSAQPMMWIGGSKANMYWRKDGTHSHTRIALGAEAVGRLGEIDPDLPRMLLPKGSLVLTESRARSARYGFLCKPLHNLGSDVLRDYLTYPRYTDT